MDLFKSSVNTIDDAFIIGQQIIDRLKCSVVGRDAVIELIVIALLADGHVLLEDYPGSGKTTLAKALGDSIIDDNPHDAIEAMRRVQFTPDLLPSDVTGTTIFDAESKQFFFRHGPVFAHVLLADEINRTSPKVQSALLEAMSEKQVTVDNKTHPLDELFFVIATQNPLDLAGTFPLPSAQLDRFMFKIKMNHIDNSSELDLLMRFEEIKKGADNELPRVNRGDVVAAREVLRNSIHIAPSIKEALVMLADETRESNRSLQGVSTRSLVLSMSALQARAMLKKRRFVIPEDLEFLAPYIFSHRLMMAPGAGEPEEVIADALKKPMEYLARASVKK
jgi:MoxR-like ATPase